MSVCLNVTVVLNIALIIVAVVAVIVNHNSNNNNNKSNKQNIFVFIRSFVIFKIHECFFLSIKTAYLQMLLLCCIMFKTLMFNICYFLLLFLLFTLHLSLVMLGADDNVVVFFFIFLYNNID